MSAGPWCNKLFAFLDENFTMYIMNIEDRQKCMSAGLDLTAKQASRKKCVEQ